MLEELTLEELAEWFAYFHKHGWQRERDDLRQEALVHRIVAGIGGVMGASVDESKLPDWEFPYFQPMPTPAEIRAAARETADNIEPNGKGGYKWKEGYRRGG